jgi:methylated-DNA-[protein]-cysteine S-methyltransferase
MAGLTNIFETPWGWMGIAASELGIQSIVLPTSSRRAVQRQFSKVPYRNGQGEEVANAKLLQEAQTQLLEFLANRRRDLDFPIDMSHGTSFQRQVWRTIRRIPYGRVRSYRWVADRVGGPHYARAVGYALGANPVPIIVPCHRVVTSDGALGGFTGGLSIKRRLLHLEGTLTQLRSSA